VPARQDNDLKKAASSRQRRREERATDPVVRQKAVAHAEEATAADQNEVAKATAKVADKARFNCDQCEYSNTSEKGLKQHKRMKHITVLKTPEKERHTPQLGDLSLNVSPDIEERKELCGNCGAAAALDHQCDTAPEEEVDSNTRHPCPLGCKWAEWDCNNCDNCDECTWVKTEDGLNQHIMYEHEPSEVIKTFGEQWCRERLGIVSKNHDYAQERKKWDKIIPFLTEQERNHIPSFYIDY
jgi:hypothetical protein